MLKIIIILATLFLAGFLVVNDHWFITIAGFGYEITVSGLLLLFTFLIGLYLIHLIKCPYHWICRLQGKRTQNQHNKRETYLIRVMQTFLENNEAEKQQLLKQRKTYWDNSDSRNQIIEAVLSPNETVFEKLSQQPETELSGLYGLYEIYKKEGNLKEQELILKRAISAYPNIKWIHQGLFDLFLLQQDWEAALKQLEQLKNLKLISKEEYQNGLAGLYLKSGRTKEAYALNKKNPAIAIAYAADNPDKAAEVLLDSFRVTPSWETYLLYMDLFKDKSAAQQMKALKKLISKNPTSRLALLATADTSIRLELWSHAKETMEVYLKMYPHTRQAMQLMADIVRKGWHHEEEARKWENEPIESEDLSGWYCKNCNHAAVKWDIVCPHCNVFDGMRYR